LPRAAAAAAATAWPTCVLRRLRKATCLNERTSSTTTSLSIPAMVGSLVSTVLSASAFLVGKEVRERIITFILHILVKSIKNALINSLGRKGVFPRIPTEKKHWFSALCLLDSGCYGQHRIGLLRTPTICFRMGSLFETNASR